MTATADTLDTSKYEDIYNIICGYTFSNKNIVAAFRSAESNSDIYEFIDTAFIYYIDHLYGSYDESKGALSTHIYASLKNIYPVILTQSKYNVSNYTARRLCDGSEKGKQRREKLKNIYISSTSIDCCDSSLDYGGYSDSGDENKRSRCLDLADENNEIENYEDEINNKDALSAFYSCLDRYMARTKEEFRERNRNMIIDYTFSADNAKTTLKTLSDKYNITRERARQITTGFYEYAQRDPVLRGLLHR